MKSIETFLRNNLDELYDLSLIPSLGKRIGHNVYLCKDLFFNELSRLGILLDNIEKNINIEWNVIKINSLKQCFSLLYYKCIDTHSFPSLVKSVTIYTNKVDSIHYREHRSINPPILHRKELLLPPDHPDIPKFAALTKQLEDAGLFKDSRKIGYKKQWEERLRNAGYKVVDHQLVRLDGSEIEPPSITEKTSNVERHRTALTRYALSKPMQLLAKHDFLEGKHTIFDYGCGKGSDVDILRQNNLTANGWDPHFCPENPKHSADVVNLGFVINVIEDKDERLAAVLGAYQLCTQFLCAAVMLGEQSPERGRLFRDGVLTSRNTFQRYYSQEEFREYLRRVLDEEPVAVGPGVFFVFKDKDAEQAFLERRYRNRSTANRLINQIPKQPKAPKATRPTKTEKEQAFYQQHADLLDALWLSWLELGRPPQEDEFSQVVAVKDLFGTWQRGLNFLQRFHGTETLKFAFESRREDLTVYFAMRRFDQQRVYRHLPESLKRDVKAFFTSYPLAQTEGERLLFSAGNPALIRQMCHQAAASGYGYLDAEGSLTFHTSQVVLLPPILRVYIGCATQVFGDVTSADLLKIHAESGKLSLMKYDDFEELALPRLLERIKISLVNQRFEYYKYGETFTPPYLYLKARFLTADYPHYAEQLAFDQALSAIPELDLDAYGMSPEQFDAALQRLRLEVNGFALQIASTLPKLDAPCGEYHTFRHFIECGATQAKTGLPNLPKQAATYNALAVLATQVLDPVMDYFGGIQLTYGFCSPELAKHIKGCIDPKRDQHAAHELNTRGNLICERKGAACDFIVPDENMLEVAQWIVANTPFDRLYFYGNTKPLHVSYGEEHSRVIVLMLAGKSGRLIPKVVTAERFAELTTDAQST